MADIQNDVFYVTEKTKVKCTWGKEDSVQLKESGHGVFKMNGNTPMPVMNMMDNMMKSNIPDFGKCKNMLNPMVVVENPDAATPAGLAKVAAKAATEGACTCTPLFPAPWINASMKTHTDGSPTINQKSCIACAMGFGLITIEGNVGGLISLEEIENNYMYKVTGMEEDIQTDLNNYFRDNVWNDADLSNDSKIAIMVANFDALTPDQKKDFNILGGCEGIKK